MIEKKRRIIVADFEYRLLVKALAEFRNQLLEAKKTHGRYQCTHSKSH